MTVCVLTGAGKNFCAGVDLKEPLFADPEIMTPEWIKGEGNYLVQMQKCDFPIIGAGPRRADFSRATLVIRAVELQMQAPALCRMRMQGLWLGTARRGAWRWP